VLAAPAQEPHELVQETSDKVLKIINTRGKELEHDPEMRYRLIDKIILPLVDFQVFSQLVLGTHWRTAIPDQRRRFTTAFQSMLVRTYTKSLSDYAGTEVTVLPARGKQREEYRTVYTEMRTSQSEPPLTVSYSFRLSGGQWKVYDMNIGGLSLVTNFRSSFDSAINRNGLNALIKRLERGDEKLAPKVASP
jgi:phospholipid transport system substrate-binding protein